VIPGFPIPGSAPGDVLVPAPAPGAGNWVGAPSAVAVDRHTFVIAYRLRTATERGSAVLLARWTPGESPVPIGRIDKDRFGAESLERPALVHLPDGSWRMFLSCATPGSKHWWIESVSGGRPEDLSDGIRRMEFPGDERVGVKDPVVRVDRDGLSAWICCHPLEEPGEEDRMTTALAVLPGSADRWDWRGMVLSGTPGTWDSRGARVTAVVAGVGVAYDGRASKEENFAERTGLAVPVDGAKLSAVGDRPVADVRYLDVVTQPGGGYRLFYEAPLPDGSHQLWTEEQPGGGR
jgi:hypothetical protein